VVGLVERAIEVDPATLDALMAFEWRRNNVRELRNVVERLVFAADGDVIQPNHLPEEIRAKAARAGRRRRGHTYQDQRAEAERAIVVGELEKNGWQIAKTAEDLGLADHASLLKIMRRLSIKRSSQPHA
jgi:DNA-binding NtrC family response regulator